MKSLLAVALASAMVLATTAVAIPHIVEEFSIKLPNGAYTNDGESTPLTANHGDMLYVATGNTGNFGLSAIDTATKSLKWSRFLSNNPNFNGIEKRSFYFAKNAVWFYYTAAWCSQNGFNCNYNTSFIALDATTGIVNGNITIPGELSGRVYYNVSTNGDRLAILGSSRIIVVTTANNEVIGDYKIPGGGYVINHKPAGGGEPIVYDPNFGAEGTEIGAFRLFSGTTVWVNTQGWSLPSTGGTQFLPLLGNLLLVANQSADFSNTDLHILDVNTGVQKSSVNAVSGIIFDVDQFTPTLDGDKLTILAGEETLRLLEIDINTGVILKQTFFDPTSAPSSNIGGNGQYCQGDFSGCVYAADIDSRIRVTSELELDLAHPAADEYQRVARFVPSTGNDPNLRYWSQGVVQAGNLQGYTLWEINVSNVSAAFLSRTETVPNWYPSGLKTADGAYISINGDRVVGEKLVF